MSHFCSRRADKSLDRALKHAITPDGGKGEHVYSFAKAIIELGKEDRHVVDFLQLQGLEVV